MGNELARVWGLVATLGVVGAAAAAPRTVVVAAGDCADPGLSTLVSRLDAELRALARERVVSGDLVLSRVRPGPELSTLELKARLEAARSLVYSGKPEEALALLTQIIAAMDRSSPEVAPFSLLATALATEGLVLKQLDRRADAAEVFKRIVRVDSSYALDPDTFSPSTLQALDAAKKELARAKKLSVTVHAAPEGAEVFVDGRVAGTSPLTLSLAPGRYRIFAGQGKRLSFAHPLELVRDETLEIDLAFEGAVSTTAPLCLWKGAGDARAVARLAALASADQVVLFSFDAAPGQPWRVKASARPVSPPGAPRDYYSAPEALDSLARAVLSAGAPQSAPPDPALQGQAATTLTPQPLAAPQASPAPVPETARVGHPSNARLTSYGLFAGGALGVVVGSTVWLLGEGDRARLRALTLPDGTLVSAADPRFAEAVATVDSTQRLALIAGGLGAGLLVSGALVAALFPAEAPPVSVTAFVAPGASGVVVRARF